MWVGSDHAGRAVDSVVGGVHHDVKLKSVVSLVGVTNIGGSVVDNVPPVTGLIGWRSVVELRRLRLVLMRVELECGDLVCCSGR